jgi:hypothetical protein
MPLACSLPAYSIAIFGETSLKGYAKQREISWLVNPCRMSTRLTSVCNDVRFPANLVEDASPVASDGL